MARPEQEPTEKTRNQVKILAGIVPREVIAAVLGISKGTLRKHYRQELDHGQGMATAMVVGKLFANCMKGKEASIFFWLKCQAGWRERNEIDPGNRQPLIPEVGELGEPGFEDVLPEGGVH